jgi:hypothetical protein
MSAICVDFLYQITFFIALLVLDERRIQANRMDWCTFIKVKNTTPRDETAEEERGQALGDEHHDAAKEATADEASANTQKVRVAATVESDTSEDGNMEAKDQEQVLRSEHEDAAKEATAGEASMNNHNVIVASTVESDTSEDENMETRYAATHPADRFMAWFATNLLKTKVQVLVVLIFCFVLGGSIYNATQLRQEFDFTELVPRDSYLKRYYNAWERYSNVGLYVHAIFRDVDQSDPVVQEQMEKYVNDLVTKGPADDPVYFWLRDFKAFMNDSANRNLTELPFEEQIDAFLEVPINYELYDGSLGRPSGGGKVYESRVQLHMRLDQTAAKEATDMLASVRGIGRAQEVNREPGVWKFFTYVNDYHLYE